LSYFSRVAGPFLVGLIVGATLLFSSQYWLTDVETVARVLAVLAGVLVTILLIIWFFYRWFVARLSGPDEAVLKEIWQTARDNPRLLLDRHFWADKIGPHFSIIGPAVGAWLSFAASLGIITLVLTNILLLATLLVQMISAERLASQNDLIASQNAFLQTQARVDATRLIQEELARQQLYERRWAELEAFRLTAYGRVSGEKFTVDRFAISCARGQNICAEFVYLERPSRLAYLFRERLAERKESFLDRLETAAIRDPAISRTSKISEILSVMRAASNDCFGKEEFTKGVVEDLRALLRLEFAVSAFEISKSGLEAERRQPAAGDSLESAFVDFRRQFFGQKLVMFTWKEFPDVFAEVVERIDTDIVGVIGYCRFAAENSDRLIEELRYFLNETAPLID